MSIITLVSGGLDSTLVAVMTKESGVKQYPLFVDYGQRAVELEWKACASIFKKRRLPRPQRVSVNDFGALVPSGLTSRKLNVVADAFLPGRNLLFLLLGAAYAATCEADAIAIGLLSEKTRLFEDQSRSFLRDAQRTLRVAVARPVSIVAPLMKMSKRDVLRLAREKDISGTYSCHAGTRKPCGKCLSCRERLAAEEA
jgi:7-cyano-7-deazaguanine synthase